MGCGGLPRSGFEPKVNVESSDMFMHARLVESGLVTTNVPGLALSSVEPGLTLASLVSDDRRQLSTAVQAGSSKRPSIEATRQQLGKGTNYRSSFLQKPQTGCVARISAERRIIDRVVVN